jgi:hypothetical protein
MTRWRLGINTCFAVKRWPEPSEWARIVRDELELDFVQHSLDLVDVQAPDEILYSEAEALREACTQFGLTLESTFTGLAAYSSNLLLDPRVEVRDHWEGWFRRAMVFTAAAGGGLIGGHVGAFAVSEWQDPERRAAGWRRLQEALRRLAHEGKCIGLDGIYVENLAVAREPSTMPQMEDLLTDGDDDHVPIVLCLDVGHQCVPGASARERDPYAWLQHFGSRLGCVQIQQTDAESDHHWAFAERFNRQGRIDAHRVLEVLEGAGPEEVGLILEVIPPFEQDDAQALQDLVDSARYWRGALAAHTSE